MGGFYYGLGRVMAEVVRGVWDLADLGVRLGYVAALHSDRVCVVVFGAVGVFMGVSLGVTQGLLAASVLSLGLVYLGA